MNVQQTLISAIYFILVVICILEKSELYRFKFFINIFLFLIIMSLGILYAESKKREFFYHSEKIKISKNYIGEIIYQIDNHNFESTDFLKLNYIINGVNERWSELRNLNPYYQKDLIKLNSIFLDFKKKIETINKNINSTFELQVKKDKIIDSIPYVLDDLLLGQELILNKHPIQQLLIIKELDKRLGIIDAYINFAYYSNHGAILDNPIDLTLSDYIATLRENPNMANANYTIAPEIQNKIKTLNIEIQAFKKSFRAALAVQEAVLAIHDKNLELNATLTQMYNQQIIKELMIMTLYSWLCVFFCGYGYVRAVNKNKKDDGLESEL